MKPDRDVVIIGAGAAGMSAAQYAARSNLSVTVFEELGTGGQFMLIDNLENYPGFPEPLPGLELSQRFEDQAVRFGAEIQMAGVHALRKDGALFHLETDNGSISSFVVVLATGAKHKTLDIPGEKEFSGRGVSYCANCDGPFFKGKRMLVVGGGDAACDEAQFLAHLTEDLLMVHRRDRFRAQRSLAERVLKNPHIEVRFNHEVKQILGSQKVEEATLLDNQSGKTYNEKVDAVFIFVGSIPQTALVQELGVEFDEGGYVLTNQDMQTSVQGLFAIGDVRTSPFRQLVVAAADGAIAAHAAAEYIDELKGEAYE
ncbi:MAG: thioredoxin-disulfide reductase [Spirochaetales bacterium]|nr:thioredoxin-disulfide reductase [Spirochaetales bacterium]